jgi:hypothetical protein
MRVRLFCNGVEAPVTRFIGELIGHVCLGILASLKDASPKREAMFEVRGDKINVQVDGHAIAMDQSQGFATVIVSDTLNGMLRNLKGIDYSGTSRIEVHLNERSKSQ